MPKEQRRRKLDEIMIHKGTQTVGDVEVTTAIRVLTPEHDKLAQVSDESQAIGVFLDWLMNARPDGNLTLCHYLDRSDRLIPAHVSIQDLLAEYFEIDQTKIENEKRATLEAIRR